MKKKRVCVNCWLCKLVPQHGGRECRDGVEVVELWFAGFCHSAITDEDIAAAQREECNKYRSGVSLCGIEDCRKCLISSVFDSEKYITITFDAAVGETDKSESKFCHACEHAHVSRFPHILYGRKRDDFKFFRNKNRSVNASDSACGEYSPKEKSFPKDEPKPTQKQAIGKLRQKNRARFARKTLSDSEVYRNATPEERDRMAKLADYLLASEQSSTKRQPCSADKLRRSSVYKCALPDDREAMLIRHYELELARISHLLDGAVDKALHAASCDFDHVLALSGVIEEKKKEINGLKEANANLALEVKRLNTRLCVRKKIADKYKITAEKKLKRANDEVVALNGCNRKLEEEVEELKERLAGAGKLEGKWRLLDKGEPYMRGDLHQTINPDHINDWEWLYNDELAGDKHDGQDIVIRRMTFK